VLAALFRQVPDTPASVFFTGLTLLLILCRRIKRRVDWLQQVAPCPSSCDVDNVLDPAGKMGAFG
jgi:hypothetical protein